ncbi:MAG TPA: hypothetical protein VMS60_02075 [Solirubrobacterales bacterium]|nr:hypothetical protein [Solirubrobacterales bacterium]
MVQPQGRGPQEYPLETLDDGEFEALVFLLARVDDQTVVPIRNQDRGLDVRLPDRYQRTRRGWQAKRFEKGKIHWAQCRESVEAAVAFWRPPRITFVFAHELSGGEQKKFRTELVERLGLPIVLDYMPEAEIQRRLRDTPEGQQAAAWLFKDSEPESEAMRRAYAMGGELRDAAHAAERLGEIQRHLNRDPHLDYTTITSKAGAPPTEPAEGTALSISTQEGGEEIRFDAREKFPGALEQLGLEGAFVFTEDDAGVKAREALLEAHRTGRSVSIESGIGIQMTNVPVGLRGVMTDEPVFGSISLIEHGESTPPGQPSSLVGIVVAGDHEIGLSFAPMDNAIEGWDVTMGGAAGGLEIFHSMRGDLEASDHRLDWRHTFGEGSALEQLLACRLLRAALEGEAVQFVTPGTRKQMWLSERLEGDFAADIEDLHNREELLEFVVEVEVWAGEPLVVPTRPTKEDAAKLSKALGRIRSPEFSGSWEHVNVILTETVPPNPIEVLALEPLEVTIFGSEVFLGVEELRLPLANATPTEDGVRLTPVDGHEGMVGHLHHPTRVPAEAARAPGQSKGGRVLVRVPQPHDAEAAA